MRKRQYNVLVTFQCVCSGCQVGKARRNWLFVRMDKKPGSVEEVRPVRQYDMRSAHAHPEQRATHFGGPTNIGPRPSLTVGKRKILALARFLPGTSRQDLRDLIHGR